MRFSCFAFNFQWMRRDRQAIWIQVLCVAPAISHHVVYACLPACPAFMPARLCHSSKSRNKKWRKQTSTTQLKARYTISSSNCSNATKWILCVRKLELNEWKFRICFNRKLASLNFRMGKIVKSYTNLVQLPKKSEHLSESVDVICCWWHEIELLGVIFIRCVCVTLSPSSVIYKNIHWAHIPFSNPIQFPTELVIDTVMKENKWGA